MTTRPLADLAPLIACDPDEIDPLDLSDLPMPIILDESDNLIDGHHRLAGLIAANTPESTPVPCVVIPDRLGEILWGRSLSDRLATWLAQRYASDRLTEQE